MPVTLVHQSCVHTIQSYSIITLTQDDSPSQVQKKKPTCTPTTYPVMVDTNIQRTRTPDGHADPKTKHTKGKKAPPCSRHPTSPPPCQKLHANPTKPNPPQVTRVTHPSPIAPFAPPPSGNKQTGAEKKKPGHPSLPSIQYSRSFSLSPCRHATVHNSQSPKARYHQKDPAKTPSCCSVPASQPSVEQ